MKPFLVLLFGAIAATVLLSQKRTPRLAVSYSDTPETTRVRAEIAALEAELTKLDAKAPAAAEDADPRFFTSHAPKPITYLH